MSQELPVNIVGEMKQSYLDYSMSVIVGRALPDVRDGLKPVHRRILYAMFNEGLLSNRRYSKCAGVVGEVLKKYHPHGDSAVYDALVRLAQPWNMRYPLVDGQGNFGSIDGDRAAAYRYTEARMKAIAEEMLADIEKETVDWQPNFDEQVLEPLVLPSKIPNLLLNGSSGIAVGMATNIPPHNLGEIVDALLHLIEHPDSSIDQLMQFVKGPDFPTGGVIYGLKGINDAYKTGRGKIYLRAKYHIEEPKDAGRTKVVIDEIPYMVNKSKILEKIAELVKEQRVDSIAELRDESDRHGMRIVIELKKGEMPEVLINQLYRMTALQTTVGVIMLALVNKQPRILNLKQILEQFVAFRKDVVTRRTQFLLRKAERKAHLLAGYVKALDVLDALIALIRAAQTPAQAKSEMMERWDFTPEQAQAILELRLQKLTGMERAAILKEYEEILEEIKRLKEILEVPAVLQGVIVGELEQIRASYQDERRTEILDREIEFSLLDLITDENVVVTCSHRGYIKQTPVTTYKEQNRGGKGRIGMKTHDDDFVENLFVAATHDVLMVFTNLGRVHWVEVHQIPQTDAASKGKAIVNLIQLEKDEKPVAFHAVREFSEDIFLVFATKNGLVKKTPLSHYKNKRVIGIKAINILEDDELIRVRQSDGDMDIFIATTRGKSIRFAETDIRSMGRVSTGVRGIKLADGDAVEEMAVIGSDEGSILTVSQNGYGKATYVAEYRRQNRGGNGILNMKLTDKTGEIAGVRYLGDHASALIISQFGKLIRLNLDDIRRIGRVTQGVRMIHLDDVKDRVVGVGLIPDDDETIVGEDEVNETVDETKLETAGETEAPLEESTDETAETETEE